MFGMLFQASLMLVEKEDSRYPGECEILYADSSLTRD